MRAILFRLGKKDSFAMSSYKELQKYIKGSSGPNEIDETTLDNYIS
jgi:hypothetical protein